MKVTMLPKLFTFALEGVFKKLQYGENQNQSPNNILASLENNVMKIKLDYSWRMFRNNGDYNTNSQPSKNSSEDYGAGKAVVKNGNVIIR